MKHLEQFVADGLDAVDIQGLHRQQADDLQEVVLDDVAMQPVSS